MQLSCYSVSASRQSLLSCKKGTSRGRPIEQKMRFIVIILAMVVVTMSAAEPGLLRVPKVYNAVITSNQNLSPSRAYPVIQPVVHRTAIGYVPPFDYTQVVSSLSGQEAVYLPQAALQPNGPIDVRAEHSSAIVERTKSTDVKGQNSAVDDKDVPRQVAKNKNEEQEPLSFYPNDLSLYYDPYVNHHPYFNGFSPLLLSSLYYANRQQQYDPLEPIPASTPKYGPSGQLLPAFHEEKKITTEDRTVIIPDVPPPPLPTAQPKSS